MFVYHTSKEYRKLLKSSKINNITIKKENGKYYAIINIITSVNELKPTGENIGIDLGLKKSGNTIQRPRDNQSRPKTWRSDDKKIPKETIQTKIHEQKLSKNTKKIP